ncbi:hypothetical protein MOUN0_N01002 [Monosporozyma unispora]|nr:Oxidoreductase [Kazachstania unispora]
MIKQLCNSSRLAVLLRRTFHLSQPHSSFVLPHIRYLNTSNKDNGSQYSNKRHSLEIDLIASSLGLIATLTAVYFITPKIETKKSIKKMKSTIEPTPPKNILSEDNNNTISSKDESTPSIDNAEPNVIECHNMQDAENKVAKNLDVPNDEAKKQEEVHIELEEIVVPGDINILNPHKTPSHYIHEDEKLKIRQVVNEVPVEQDIQIHKDVLEEEPKDQNKDDEVVSSKEEILNVINVPANEPELESNNQMRNDKPIPVIFDSNKDKLDKNENESGVNKLDDQSLLKEFENVNSTIENKLSNIDDSTPIKDLDSNRPPRSERIDLKEPLNHCNDADKLVPTRDIDETDFKLNENIKMEASDDKVSNNSFPSNQALDVAALIEEEFILAMEQPTKNIDNTVLQEIDEEKPIIELANKDDLPLPDVPSSFTKDQKDNLLPHEGKGKPIAIEESEDSISSKSIKQVKQNTRTQLADTDDIPFQDTPLSITDDQKADILPPAVKETFPSNAQTNETNDRSNDGMTTVTDISERESVDTPKVIRLDNENILNITNIEEGAPSKKKLVVEDNPAITKVTDVQPEPVGGVEGVQRAYDPDTGEINWDCPCLGGLAQGPCGEEFKLAFSCFVYSEKEPKGSECLSQFQGMQTCFQKHPDYYLNDDDSKITIEDESAI